MDTPQATQGTVMLKGAPPQPADAMPPLRKAEILNEMERKFMDGRWSTGDQLPSERELCLSYGVSRPVIREVLAGLVERGFVEVHPGRGYFVRDVTVDELSHSLTRAASRTGITARDLVAARVALECAAVELAAQRGRRTSDALARALQAHEAAEGVAGAAQTDLAFHEALVAASGNPVLRLMFGSIRAQVFALMLRSHSDIAVQAIGDPMHHRIVAAVLSGDSDQSRELMRKHLELALELYGDDLDRPIRDVLRARGIREGASLAHSPSV